jgi:hypothetical protein
MMKKTADRKAKELTSAKEALAEAEEVTKDLPEAIRILSKMAKSERRVVTDYVSEKSPKILKALRIITRLLGSLDEFPEYISDVYGEGYSDKDDQHPYNEDGGDGGDDRDFCDGC